MSCDMDLLAYCGLYCGLCSSRVASEEGDWKHLEHPIPASYKRGRTDLADYACGGCKGPNLCDPCAIKICASGKELDSCAACADFPCRLLDQFENDGTPHHRLGVENLREIRERGIEAWFGNLTPALRCHCGKRQSWYHTCQEHS